MIQFFWQFPHFWAIAWFLDDDYKKALEQKAILERYSQLKIVVKHFFNFVLKTGMAKVNKNIINQNPMVKMVINAKNPRY